MMIDPKTTVGRLIAALPSTASVLQAYGIVPRQVMDKPLWKALTDARVDVEEFLHALHEIDWDAELPLKPDEWPNR